MSKRNIIVLILLILGIGALYYSTNKEKQEEEIKHNYILKSISFKKISQIKLKNFLIRNENGTWKIDNRTCNSHEIEYLVNLLKSVDFNNVISDNKNSFPKFMVTDNQSIKVEIKTSDGKNYKIYIGKMTPDGNGCYVRYKDKVYLITKNIRIDFNKSKSDFYLNKELKVNKKQKTSKK